MEMINFEDFMLTNEARKTKASTRLLALEAMLKPYNTNYSIKANKVSFGFYSVVVTTAGYELYKNDELVGTYKVLDPIEKCVEDEYIALKESEKYTIHELHPDDAKRYARRITISLEQLNIANEKFNKLKADKKLSSLDWSYEGNDTYEASSEAFELLGLNDLKNINETLSTVQVEGLKDAILAAMDIYDKNMSVKDFAVVIGTILSNEYGSHNFQIFNSTLKSTLDNMSKED
jgi:hypothetical protein